MSPNRLAWAEAGFEQVDAEDGLVSCMKRVLDAARREAWTGQSRLGTSGSRRVTTKVDSNDVIRMAKLSRRDRNSGDTGNV